MIEKIIIKPLIGIEGLSLGITKEEARNILGPPDKCSVQDFKQDGSHDEDWEYWKLGLKLTFSSEDNWLLGTIEVASKEATLAGHRLIDLTEEQLLERLNQIDITPTILEDDFMDLSLRNFFCDKYSLTFWVQDGIVTSIAIFPKNDESGNTPLWPKHGTQ